MTLAEDGPFTIFTKISVEALFCRSSIVGVVGSSIVGNTSSTEKIVELPFKIRTGLVIVDDRTYS